MLRYEIFRYLFYFHFHCLFILFLFSIIISLRRQSVCNNMNLHCVIFHYQEDKIASLIWGIESLWCTDIAATVVYTFESARDWKFIFFFIETENSFWLKYKILLLVSKRMSDFIKRITHTAWMMLDVQICYHDILTRLWPILLYFYYLHFQHIDISVIHLFFVLM